MERTKIPKANSKVPSKLPTIVQSKVFDAKSTSDLNNVAAARHVLRRRSKSVTDLRTTASKNKKIFDRPLVQKPVAPKAALKRTAPSAAANEDVAKPKMTKKIPDWDYKSRFLDLQTKHNTLKEHLKTANNKLLSTAEIQAEVTTLRGCKFEQALKNQNLEEKLQRAKDELSNTYKHHDKKIQEFEATVQKLRQENNEFTAKIVDLETRHSHLELEFEATSRKFQSLMADNKELKQQVDDLSHLLDDKKKECKEHRNEIEHLQMCINEHDLLRRVLHNKIQDLRGNIRVFCRVRPAVTAEEHDREQCLINYLSETNLEIRKSRDSISTINGKPMDVKQEFCFDRVFSPQASQTEVFEELSQLLQSALDGYNVCVFAYGQTGSGKTHTMQGSSDNLGMIPRAIDFLFQNIQKLERAHWSYSVRTSFLEIYNENVRDLLQPDSGQTLEIKYNEGRGVTVTNLSTVLVKSAEELLNAMDQSHRNRAVAATNFNEHSSRSHAVTKIELEGFNTNTKTTYSGSVSLVDLAGSESAKTSAKERIAETKCINKSLSTLGMVMIALYNKENHIPYRNSKLTFLLQSCLGGNSKTLMFVHIPPFEECHGESINSLRFASKVKDIKTSAKKNRVVDCANPAPPLFYHREKSNV